jgi:transcriptional regulator with XRE-family HTH domain
VVNLNKDLNEFREIDEKLKNKLNYLKTNPQVMSNNINEIKAVKNNIYEKTSKVFVYNLKKLIQLESTQKNLANKIGISEDLLSKYKSGDAFPSIETLIYICEVYNMGIEKLISIPLTAADIENLENNNEIEINIFEEKYYVYFLVTNIAKEGSIHEGIMEIKNNNVTFKICSHDKVLKSFTGYYSISDKIIFFDLQSQSDGITYINMIKPNVNKNKYVGGLAMMMLPSDANSKPCVQKILFSKIKLDRDEYYEKLKEILSFSVERISFGNVKVSQWEDEEAYNFILRQL